jgi:hypothetical protein
MDDKKERERDNRALTEKSLSAFKEDGAFAEFVKFVKEHKDKLMLCFRGNSDTQFAAVYYNNHQVWKLYPSKGYRSSLNRVKIIFNHARYTEKWETQLATLNANFKFSKFKKGSKPGEIISHGDPKGEFSKDFVEGTYDIMKPIMNDFFCIKKNHDYFKGEDRTRAKPNQVEKQAQQRLYNLMKKTQDGIFVYDAEFTDRDSSETEKKNKPDLLGIRFDKKGNPTHIVFIEVKSKKDSLWGTSGFQKHNEGMQDYIRKPQKIEARINEAGEIMQAYKELGLKGLSNNTNKFKFENLPAEIMFVFTDDLITKDRQSTINCLKGLKDEEKKNCTFAKETSLGIETIDINKLK